MLSTSFVKWRNCTNLLKSKNLMRPLEFPIDLTKGVQIINRTRDDCYIVRYKSAGGAYGVIWLPDDLEKESHMDPIANEAIEMVRSYLTKHVANT